MYRKMPRKFDPSTLHPQKWWPSDERRSQMEELLWDKVTMLVFTDCSLSPVSKLCGIAAVFVHDGSVTVKAKKIYPTFCNLKQPSGNLKPFCTESNRPILLFNPAQTFLRVSWYSAIWQILSIC